MSCNKEKEVIMALIDMYKDMPHLWQKDHQSYLNRDMRAEGFKVLLEIYKNFDEKATIKTIKKKIENMRTCYTKELKKVSVSKRTGAGADEIYVPTLWYFDALSFLGTRTESCRTLKDSENVDSTSDDETASVTNSIRCRPKKKNTVLQKQENILLSAEKIMAQKDEEWEVYGRSIGFQLKDLNKRQLMISQKIISDVIFYAKLDQLSEYSYVVTTSPNDSMPNNSRHYQRQNHFYLPSPSSNYSSPSPSHQIQSPHHSSSHVTLRPHSRTLRQPSPQHQAQLSSSPIHLPYQPSPNTQVQVNNIQTVCQPLNSPHSQLEQLNSSIQLTRPHQPTSNIQKNHSVTPHLPNTQANDSLYHQSHEQPSPNSLAEAQLSHQEPSDCITVDNSEEFLDYFPNENSSDPNSSLPIIEGPGAAMKEFLIIKRKN